MVPLNIQEPCSFTRLLAHCLRLGALGFGGPIALAGRMDRDVVEERAWVSRQDYVEEAWRIVDPVLKAATPLHEYEIGTWGPSEVDEIVRPSGGWVNPTVSPSQPAPSGSAASMPRRRGAARIDK